MQVTGHDGDTLAVDGAQVGVGQDGDDVGLGGLLQGKDGGAGEAETLLVVGGELAHQALEGSLAEQQVGGPLELFHLTQCDGAGVPTALGVLLDTGGRLCGLLLSFFLSGVTDASITPSRYIASCGLVTHSVLA